MKPSLPAFVAIGLLASVASTEEISYRLLSPTDFQASGPPVEVLHHPEGVDAASCLRVVWPADLAVQYSDREILGSRHVVARLPRVEFEAAFDTSCSWWAPSPSDEAYVLAHEQVHFAIVEHEARRLTQEMDAGAPVEGRGSSREEARENLRRRLKQAANSAQRFAREAHGSFDAATRADRSPVVQMEWIRRYENLLGTRLLPGSPPGEELQRTGE